MSLFSLSPLGRGRGPLRQQWEGEGEQLLQLRHLLPLILPRLAARAPPSPPRGGGKLNGEALDHRGTGAFLCRRPSALRALHKALGNLDAMVPALKTTSFGDAAPGMTLTTEG